MGLTVDPYRKAAYAGTESKQAKPGKAGGKSDFARVLDAVTISRQGKEALAVSKGTGASQGNALHTDSGAAPDSSKMVMQAAAIPNKAEFDAQMAKARAENQLETNWNAVVDPDGSIYSAAYVGAIVSQYQKAEAAARDYYGASRQENLSFDNSHNAVPEKYNVPAPDFFGASFFRSDMSDAERDMAFEQEKAMLLGGNARLNDPYALASAGGSLNIDEVDRAARSAAQDKLDALIRDWKAAHGISD